MGFPEDWRESLLKIKTDCCEGNDKVQVKRLEINFDEFILGYYQIMFREIKLEDFPEEISDYSTEKNDDIPFYIKAIEGANFRWNDELDDNMIDRLLNQNAPSLLLSYLRPIVAQVTSASKYGTLSRNQLLLCFIYESPIIIV